MILRQIGLSSLTRHWLATTLLLGMSVLLNSCVPDFLLADPDWVTIEAGDHEPFPKRKTGVLVSPSEISATVTFDSTCIYDLNSVDNQDWNKVIGLGFVGSKDQDLGEAPHQVDGARVGWRWNPQRQRIELGSYVYVGGQRIMAKVAETAINQPTKLTIKIDYDRKVYQVLGGTAIPFTHDKTFAYKTGLYFGGTYPAPHKIRVKIVDQPMAEYTPLHDWTLSATEAVALQQQLRHQIRIEPLTSQPETIAGCDISFNRAFS